MSISDGTIIRVVSNLLFPDNVIAQAVFHLVATDLAGGNDEDEVVQDMEEYIGDLYDGINNQISHELTPGELKVYEWDPIDEDFDEVGTGVTDATPSHASTFLPHGVALVQIFYTLDPDVQGRKFWPGITEGSYEDGVISGSTLTIFAAMAVDLVTTFTSTVLSNVYQPSVWSPTQGLAYAYNGTVATNATPGYQRRRKPGVGI